jgi:hypothetical protein
LCPSLCLLTDDGTERSYVQRVSEWLPKLQRFIEEFVSNKNFVGPFAASFPLPLFASSYSLKFFPLCQREESTGSRTAKRALLQKVYHLSCLGNATRLIQEAPGLKCSLLDDTNSHTHTHTKQDQLVRAEAGIVFSNLSFFGKLGDEIRAIQSFNTFLLGALTFNRPTPFAQSKRHVYEQNFSTSV